MNVAGLAGRDLPADPGWLVVAEAQVSEALTRFVPLLERLAATSPAPS